MRALPLTLLLASLGCRYEGGKEFADPTSPEADSGESDEADGADGADTDGADGSDGGDASDASDGADGTDGTDGGDASDGDDASDGTDGTDGTDGGDGADGTDGTSTPTEDCNGLDDDGDGEIDEGGVCPDDVTTDPASGHAYMPANGSFSWPEAVAYCASYGYYLAIVNDETENTFIWELLYDGTDGVATLGENTWIGYHDDGDGFEWVDGTSGGYEAFSGEVTTEEWGTANYGQAAAYGDFEQALWHEVPGSWTYAAMCESSGS